MSFANLSGTEYNRFGFVARAHKAKTRQAKVRLLTAAKHQLQQIRIVGWPALEMSWAQDVEVIEAMLQEKK